MKDGLQNVPFDRWLMRVKDICTIITSIGSMVTVVVGAFWFAFRIIETQSRQEQIINTLLQNQQQNQIQEKRKGH